ncbi:MAG: pitrilysin family protein, partial [Melioribacteraceae bacterium]|nr:pitrilysin family protein [Melioribacteraceae bacterium]
EREKILNHYHNFYVRNNCKIIVSGDIKDQLRPSLEQLMSGFTREAVVRPKVYPGNHESPGWLFYDSKNNYQSNIRMGCETIKRDNPDFVDLYILLTILGGYFGSRLMRNLREEKGFTYNIYAGMEAMKTASYYYITSDVGNDNLEQCIIEIMKEIKLLKDERIGEKELRMVKNYLQGRIMSLLDGPFRVSKFLKQLLIFDLDPTYFDHYLQRILHITPRELCRTANQYLDEEKMWKVVVGNKKLNI